MTVSKNDNMEIEMSVKTYIPLVIFSFLGTSALIFGFIKFLFHSYSDNTLDIVQLLFGLVAIFLFSQAFLWFIRGRERLQISSDKILFIRTNGLLTIKKSVPISDINNVIINPKTHPSDSFIDRQRQFIKEMQGAVFFWYNMGRIEFNIKNNYRTFFNGMTDKQATETVLLLSDLIKTKSDKHSGQNNST